MAYIYDPDNKFGYKDTLPEGHDEKVIKGSEFDVEFNNIATAIQEIETGSGNFIDAPPDGNLYGRKDNQWVSITNDGSGTSNFSITTRDIALTNPQRFTFVTQEDANVYFYDEIEALKSSGGGGTGGSTDWPDITNKPTEIKNLAGENASTTSLVSGGSY